MPTLAEKKKNKSVNTLLMLFMFLVVAAILTHIIPSGSFEREVINDREYVIAGSYTAGGGQSIGFFDMFEAIPLGFAKGVALFFNFMVVGGAFEVLKATGAINSGISAMIKKIGIKRGNIILVLLFLIFSALGAFLGLTDAAIPFIPVAMSIALALGYDPLVALGVTVLGAYSGSMPGPTNPSSVGVCHEIANLPLFSGMGFRLVEWVIIMAVTLTYVMLYARRVSRDYSNSLVADVDLTGMKFNIEEHADKPCTRPQKLCLLAFAVTVIFFVIGIINWKWGFNEESAAFIIMAIVVALIARMSVDDFTKTFVNGAKSMVNTVMVVSIAYGISVLLTNAGVLDTIVYWVSKPLMGMSKGISVIAIILVVTFINFFITSASGKAPILMPIILPLCDLVGISAQVATVCYQYGDVVTNVLTPLSAFVLTCLGFARVPFTKWIKFVFPLAVIWFIIGVAACTGSASSASS